MEKRNGRDSGAVVPLDAGANIASFGAFAAA